MNKLITLFASVALLFSFSLAQADDDEKYQATLNTFKDSPQVSSFFGSAYGYALFPTIGKGGIGVGGAHGKGRVYAQGAHVGNTSMTQLSIGFQLGGQAFSEVIFFETKEDFDKFTSGNFEFGAQASAVAITASANAKVGTTGSGIGASGTSDKAGMQKARYNDGMAVFTHAKGGLMYEAALSGQKFKYEAL
ncbi:YSC84-related protein [Gilvimarinus sp. DA14]|uniref:lipid-binding SYLF domain-containing protein n=1 Tax=Gilvimarinus sp. DA14 TaxID=2956798 RepID=UPI0020B86D42|nr:YSC84-related protein [Gilvimarinus sp. DA14]UTF59878.1 YSC84-related protein [Gilvimarinus sp. DA14]